MVASDDFLRVPTLAFFFEGIAKLVGKRVLMSRETMLKNSR